MIATESSTTEVVVAVDEPTVRRAVTNLVDNAIRHTPAGTTVGVEVKGYPSRNYAAPARASEQKKTQPSTQSVHWFAAAVLAAMRLRGKEPDWKSVIALPDFNRYRALFGETQGSLSAAGIVVWWVDEEGTVDFG